MAAHLLHKPPSLAVHGFTRRHRWRQPNRWIGNVFFFSAFLRRRWGSPPPTKRTKCNNKLCPLSFSVFFRSASHRSVLFVSPCSLFQAAGRVTIGLLAFGFPSGLQTVLQCIHYSRRLAGESWVCCWLVGWRSVRWPGREADEREQLGWRVRGPWFCRENGDEMGRWVCLRWEGEQRPEERRNQERDEGDQGRRRWRCCCCERWRKLWSAEEVGVVCQGEAGMGAAKKGKWMVVVVQVGSGRFLVCFWVRGVRGCFRREKSKPGGGRLFGKW